MASSLRPAAQVPPSAPRITKEATRSEIIEKGLDSNNEVLSALCQRIGEAVTRLGGSWPAPERANPPKPTSDGNHSARVDGLITRTANLLGELEAIANQLERYV